MNSIQLQNRMDTIFMNSGNNKTFDRHILLLNLSDKKKLKKKTAINMLFYHILSSSIHRKI